jgi:hypothetical protein
MVSSTNQNSDFIRVSIHCALNDPLCESNPSLGDGAVNDALPDEPGGYSGYQALFGLKYIHPALKSAIQRPPETRQRARDFSDFSNGLYAVNYLLGSAGRTLLRNPWTSRTVQAH